MGDTGFPHWSETMTPEQKKLARHALGLPNKQRTSYRNHFCAGKGHLDYEQWIAMVEARDAVRVTGPNWGGDDMFFLTWKGALQARESNEHISREDAAEMRERCAARSSTSVY